MEKIIVHPYALKLPLALWERVQIARGFADNSIFICAAVMHLLTLPAEKQAAILSDYVAMDTSLK